MPRSARLDPSQLTEVARLLLDWMWAQRPPLTIAEFATELGVAKTTAWAWFREGRLPDPKTLGRIAERTAIPLGKLYESCGYPVPESAVPESADPFDAVVASIERVLAEVVEETPFLKLLADYMYSQRPPLTAAQLAYKTHIPATTIIGWFREGRVPQPRTLQRIAAGTTIPLADLFTACGYPILNAAPEPADSFDAVVEGIRRDPWFSPEAKAAMIARVREVQRGELVAPGERYIEQEMREERSSSTSPASPAPTSQRRGRRPKTAAVE